MTSPRPPASRQRAYCAAILRHAALSVLLIFQAVSLLPAAAAAQTVGLSLPLSGRFQPLATRMEFGALLAVEDMKRRGLSTKLHIMDDGCETVRAAQLAREVRVQNVDMVVGLPCFAVAEALARVLQREPDTRGVRLLTTDTRHPLLQRLRTVEELRLHELSNAVDEEAQAVVDLALANFDGKPFAIVDDGSVYGRGLADAIRLLGAAKGLVPAVVDNFRPLQGDQRALLTRLKAAGIDALFIAAGPEDVATIARDARVLGLDWRIATGERASHLAFMPQAATILGDILLVAPAPLVAQPGSSLAQSLSEGSNPGDRALLLGYVLVEIAAQAISRGKDDLTGQSFDTAIGRVLFDSEGRARPSPFRLFKLKDSRLQTVEK